MTPSVENQPKNFLNVIMLSIWIPNWRDVRLSEAVFHNLSLIRIGWTGEYGVVVWQIPRTFLVRDPHEGLNSPICCQATAKKQQAVTHVEAAKEFRQRRFKVNVAAVAITGIVFGLTQDTLSW